MKLTAPYVKKRKARDDQKKHPTRQNHCMTDRHKKLPHTDQVSDKQKEPWQTEEVFHRQKKLLTERISSPLQEA